MSLTRRFLKVHQPVLMPLNYQRTSDLVRSRSRSVDTDLVLCSGPSCRTAICKEKIFARYVFEPSDEELNPRPVDDDDVQMADGTRRKTNRKGKGKKKAPKRLRREPAGSFLLNSDTEEDEEEDDDLSDFIVQSDEDEEEKDARREMKNAKRKAFVVFDDDDIEDTPEDRDIVFGKKNVQEKKLSPEAIQLLPRFLPSTKMKVC